MSAAPSARPNLEQVAARAGVSRATVSRVVNGVASVDPALRERVQVAVEELGYVPNVAARALVTRRSDTIALVAAEPTERVFGDPFFSGIVRGVSQQALACSVQTMLLMAQSDDDLARIERWLRTAPIDGALLISQHADHDPLPAALAAPGVPVVIGGRPPRPVAAVPFVDNDNVGGGRLAAQHLRERGRRVLATIAGPADMTAGHDRLAGFAEGLGGPPGPDLLERGDFTLAAGEAAAERLLARRPDLDGIFAGNDLMALGALRALRRLGRRVPEDVSVVGFDDVEAASYGEPPLTTVRQHTVLQGRTMVRLLLAAAGRTEAATDPEDESPTPLVDRPDRVILPVELVVRGSS